MSNDKINPDMLADGYVICICEGAAEETIMNLLLDHDCLWFTRENLVGHSITRKRKANEIEWEFLQRGYTKSVIILRILDSRSENFRLRPVYQERYPVYNIYTRPEIETLLIISEGAYDKYIKSKKSSLKPSLYCKEELSLGRHIKSKDFLEDYFYDVTKLICAITEYKRLRGQKEYCLADLLKP